MANLTPYAITLGGTDYPAKYAGLLSYIEPYLTNLETFSFSGGNVGVGSGSPPIEKLEINQGNIYSLRAGGAKLRLADQNNEVSVESLPVGIASEMVFKTNTVERMRIDKDGNLGLGVTPSAWGSNHKAINIAGASTGNLVAPVNALSTGTNYYNDNTNFLYATTGQLATRYAQNTGQHQWYTAPSGTAGNAISFTQAMTLDASGNLGIGTSSPGAKLHVSGNVSYTIPVTFAGALGNAAWATGFGTQAVNTSILATDSIVGAAVYSVSDKRLKSNITPLPGNAGLEFVKAVDPVSFDWKADNSHDTGFIAQSLMTKGYGHLVSAIPDAEMEEVTHEDGNVSPAGARFVVRYDSIVPILHAAIRDQQALIEALMARVAALESN